MRFTASLLLCIGCAGSSETAATSVDSSVSDTGALADSALADSALTDTFVPSDSTADVAETLGDSATDTAGCGAGSCETRTCGPSPCGYLCGACTGAKVCAMAGTCADSCPGTSCTDAWGASVCYGAKGYRTCPSDPAKTQLCMCSAGAWSGCDTACAPKTCLGCVNGKCKTAYTQCQSQPTCKAYLECATACADAACQTKCFTDHTSDTSDMMRGCMFGSCATECKR